MGEARDWSCCVSLVVIIATGRSRPEFAGASGWSLPVQKPVAGLSPRGGARRGMRFRLDFTKYFPVC